MRNALAASPDNGITATRTPRRRSGGSPLKRVAGQAGSLALRYPLELGLAAALCGAAGMIAWNALALQTSRHPAPLFGTRGPAAVIPAPLPPTRPMAPPAVPASVPLQPAAPSAAPTPATVAPAVPAPAGPRASRDAIGELIRQGEPATPMPPPRQAAVPTPAPAPAPVATPRAAAQPHREPQRDPIGDLIRLGDSPPIPPGYVGRPEPSRAIQQGQRALDKLGYGPLRADGLIGPGTRQAIERFERERRLPVTGEFGSRTARELSTLSGIVVE